MAMHEIDSEGDIILTLLNPRAPFAIWYEDYEDKVSHPVQPDTTREPTPTSADADAESNNDADDSNSSESSPKKEQGLPTSYEFTWSLPVKFRLSSRHLVLASKYFKSVLQGPWKEGTEIHSDNCRHIEARDWDENAMLILMQVIHGLNRKVPKLITLEMLAKIAVLVDYYRCHEAVALWSDIWIDKLKDSLPTTLDRDLILWILVTRVFEQEDLFKKATKIALPLCRGYLPTLDLPIVAVADKIEERRQEFLHRVFTHLYGLLELLRDGKAGCRFECSAMLLGALTMQMHKEGILDSRPESPYVGYSIMSIMKMVQNFESPRWTRPGYSSAHNCKLSGLLDTKMDETVEGLAFLDLI
ncbi:hypothetical protein F5Y13DRAFT_161098 [Hypoxylon sp. FL1857]|nr:hypothetical protein F5Y13DRAFT_161098 [Hypoxylon sp. FL1857]